VTYERGALTFHALDRELGDEAFWSAMRSLFGEHAAAASAPTNSWPRSSVPPDVIWTTCSTSGCASPPFRHE
jgi:hypothetical protein